MITLQQLDEAIDLYERCLKEKWEREFMNKYYMEDGMCRFFKINYSYDLTKDMGAKYLTTYICPCFKSCSNHSKVFYPRIVFLKTLREELIKEGYYEDIR